MEEARVGRQIIRRLAAGENPDEIIWDLCNTTGLSWPQAEALVQKVRSENEELILKKQSPLMILLALLIFAGGIALMGIGLSIILSAFALYNTSRDPLNSLGFVAYALHYWPAASTLVFLGFNFVLGSMIGMRKTWGVLLDSLLDRLGM